MYVSMKKKEERKKDKKSIFDCPKSFSHMMIQNYVVKLYLFVIFIILINGFIMPSSLSINTFKMMLNENNDDNNIINKKNNNDNTPSKFKKPKIISPNIHKPKSNAVEKFMMMYKCKVCSERNAQMVSKVAYINGMVVSKCKSCNTKHLIADNEGKLDMGEYGKRIEEYLKSKGDKVQRVSFNSKELEENYVIEDEDGIISLWPKMGGQPPEDVTIIDVPMPNRKSIRDEKN